VAHLTESVVEEATLGWLEQLGYFTAFGPEIAPGELAAERQDYGEVILEGRFREALARLNPDLPAGAQDDAFRKITRISASNLTERNCLFHNGLVNGVTVEYRRDDGSIAGAQARLIDFDDPDNNDWLAVNQFTVIENKHNRRPDVVIFVNGLPLAVIELKNPADEKADIWTAFNQFQTYKEQIPSLFVHNDGLIISDGLEARVGTLTSDRSRFMPWRTIEGTELANPALPQLEVLIKGIFAKRRFLDLLRYFIVFEKEKSGRYAKKMAGYHQYHAVNKAVETTVAATRPSGDRRAGVIWHTQGSGKSLTMAFFAGRIVLHPAMENPTIVVITDRNDLDDQLFQTFANCSELLRQKPDQATSRDHLRELLTVSSGGIVFTTVQKFFPELPGGKHPPLSDRRNILVIADEAHRSQYDFIDGYARHMRDALPNATFIGFTGTPIELSDKNTRSVFGDYIDIYDIQRAVVDGATVPIFYESRLAKLELKEEEKPRLDPEFEEVTEGEESERKERLKSKWAALEALVGTERRLRIVAQDLVNHFETRQHTIRGKAMIVCMSRRICVALYNEIVRLRPQWHSEDDGDGFIKVVMTGSATDPPPWQTHIRNKQRREQLADRFKDPNDKFTVAIVRDMWLTGFDVPCLHTMYVDKPMRGHGLMQAIARVNRVYGDKPGGLIVDYLGLADQLQRALKDYTDSGGEGKTAIDQEEAVAVMLEKYEICRDLFHGFDWSGWKSPDPEKRLRLLPPAQEHILKQTDGRQRLAQAVSDLSKAFALSVPHEEALRIQDDVGFFQTVKAALTKSKQVTGPTNEELNLAIQQIVSKAISSDKVIDIFATAGLKKPDISILSDEFLAEVRAMPHKNLAIEVLRKLLNGEIRTRARKNAVQARSFADLLEKSIIAYHNRSIQTIEVIDQLIALAKEMREADARGEELGLNEAELAFYDALETNDSAVKVLGDETLRTIARELAQIVRSNVTIDWTVRENIRAQLRVLVKRILRKHGYPPDKQEKATQTVLEQAELICADVAA
jgi:type I restriction enzyme R subunit